MVLDRSDKMIRQAEAIIPTPHGDLNMVAYASSSGEKMPHIAMVHPDMDPTAGPVLVRFHSECITGDLFGSKRCDCGEQLDKALEMISEHKGIVVYLRQEGRGIGIINKLKAYQLQDTGLNTIDANLHLGLEVDSRDYTGAMEILKDLGVKSVKLMTNNPLKLSSFDNSEIEVVGREPIIIDAQKENLGYLETKRDLMGHMLNG